MQNLSYRDKNFESRLMELYGRQPYPLGIEDSVRRILEDVRLRGDAAIVEYAMKFDNARLDPGSFRLSAEEIDQSCCSVERTAKSAIREAIKNVSDFARQRIPKSWSFSPRPGVNVGERFQPLDRVGVYIPGGTAPLVSTVVHTAAIAKAAGVKEIVAVTPPGRDGGVLPELVYAMSRSGVKEIYRLGGVYAIGALAYGTASVRRVEKIVGPGNAYVTAAKKLVYGNVALDMVAGPSEIMIIADTSADPEFLAADLLSQAEHDPLSQSILVSDDRGVLERAASAVQRQAGKLSRGDTLCKTLAEGVFFIEAESLGQAVEIANNYGPEHLEIVCRRASRLAKQIKAAGAIFVGAWTPEAVGDFVAGPSHVLPTGGTARYFSGLTVEQFFRRMSVVNYRKSALRREMSTIAKFAEIEGLDAHGRSAAIRNQKPSKG